MDDILSLRKRPGETPLERLERLRLEHPEYADQVLSYAGRLDPLAEGVMLVLTGGANNRRQEYLGYDKEYEVDVLLGFSTDTYDALGIVQKVISAKAVSHADIETAVHAAIGKHDQPYPPYSSKPVGGKPLFEWAREGELESIAIPTKEIEIYSLSVVNVIQMPKEELRNAVSRSIYPVQGDFRQDACIESWKRAFAWTTDTTFLVITLKAHVSSGTYMRSLAHTLGETLCGAGLALHIVRTRVGPFTLENALE